MNDLDDIINELAGLAGYGEGAHPRQLNDWAQRLAAVRDNIATHINAAWQDGYTEGFTDGYTYCPVLRDQGAGA